MWGLGSCKHLTASILLALALSAPSISGVETGEGYRYEGKVDFVKTPTKPGLPKLRLHQPHAQATAQADQELHTVLIHRDGSKFTKKLDLSEAAVKKAQATELSSSPPPAGGASPARPGASQAETSRRLLQTPGHRIQVAATDSDLSCQGCPTSDTRARITATTTYPYSALGELIGQLGTSNEGLQCSGTLLGRSHVVTAAHCVFDINDSLQYVSALDFMPGLNGGTAPYGTIDWKSVRVLSAFTSQTSYTPTAMNNDFALITLASEAPEACGYFGLYQPPSTGSVTVNITTAGYPGDKPSGTLWQSTCSDVTILSQGTGFLSALSDCTNGGCDNIIKHTCLSSDGQSGSGMWDVNNLQHAILTGKVETSADVGYNVATGIDVAVYNTIATWYNEDGGNSLPTTPVVGNGSSQSSGVSIKTPWVIAVIAAGGAIVLLIILAILISCCCRRGKAYPAKASPGAGYPQGAYAGDQYPPQQYPQGDQYPQQYPQSFSQQHPGQYNGPQDNGLPPPNGGYPQGVVYDDRSSSFVVNGQQYGQYRPQ